MVVKTDVCYFSELKIFPGHGSKFVRKDGKVRVCRIARAVCVWRWLWAWCLHPNRASGGAIVGDEPLLAA
jgi:hypothetical protein